MASKATTTAKGAPSSILETYGAMDYAGSRLSLLIDFLTSREALENGINLTAAGTKGLVDILQDVEEKLDSAMASARPDYQKALDQACVACGCGEIVSAGGTVRLGVQTTGNVGAD